MPRPGSATHIFLLSFHPGAAGGWHRADSRRIFFLILLSIFQRPDREGVHKLNGGALP